MARVALSAEPCEDCISRKSILNRFENINEVYTFASIGDLRKVIESMPSVYPKPIECEDYISRADAIARILYPDMPVVNIMGARHKWSEKYQQYRDCEKILADLPSIQPKPMQVDLEGDGYADGKIVYDYGKCPKCGWDFEYGDKDWEEPYCCHCGQKLKWFESEDKE